MLKIFISLIFLFLTPKLLFNNGVHSPRKHILRLGLICDKQHKKIVEKNGASCKEKSLLRETLETKQGNGDGWRR